MPKFATFLHGLTGDRMLGVFHLTFLSHKNLSKPNKNLRTCLRDKA
jgi:hypothetical protein